MGGFSGQFVQPTVQTITAAAASLTPRTPVDERLTLANAPAPDCSPLINYEYAVVAKQQPNAADAAALRDFLGWAIAPDDANTQRLAANHLIALPPPIWLKSRTQIDAIR